MLPRTCFRRADSLLEAAFAPGSNGLVDSLVGACGGLAGKRGSRREERGARRTELDAC